MKKAKSRFKKELEEKVSDHYYCEILNFSDRLRHAMGLSQDDIEKAYFESISWAVGDYIVYATSRRFGDIFGWIDLLEVKPARNPKEPGYSNNKAKIPDSWIYRPMGTATEILPDKTTRKLILETIKNENKEKEK